MNKLRKSPGILVGAFLLAGCVFLYARMTRPAASAAAEPATRERILLYIRERFGVPEAVKMTADPLRPFSYPAFYESTVTVDDGKQKRTQNVYVTTDHRYLVVGALYTLGTDPQAEIARHVRELFKLPEATAVAIGPFRNSPFPNLSTVNITADDGKQKQAQDFYVTKDSRCLILGNVFNLRTDPRREAVRTITTVKQPSAGPAAAPVTIVEYSDLQCPTCARLHEFIKKELLPKYGGKVRVVFKEFPLSSIHDWSLTAAIANQCAYQINPEAYVPYRSLIFKNQANFTAAGSRDLLIQLGEQAGIDRLQLAACIDSKATLPRVEENTREGQAVHVSQTPTSFINGKMVVGMPPAETFYKIVDEVLSARRSAPRCRTRP
jgi:protein-disulfide isomerase